SSGPAGDLIAATKIAAQMVGVCGFGKSLVSLAADDDAGPFSSGLVSKILGDRQMRAEVDKMLGRAYTEAEDILNRNRTVVDALAEAVVQRGELLGNEIIEVIEATGAAAGGKAIGNAALDLLRED